MRQADLQIASGYIQKLELDERVAELEALKWVVPEPNGEPSLQETLMENESQKQLRLALLLVQSSSLGDVNVLQALVNEAKAKIAKFEGADEAKDGEQGEQDRITAS
jgi:hypothetical protein